MATHHRSQHLVGLCCLAVMSAAVSARHQRVDAATPPVESASARAATLRARGLDYGFNLRYQQAFDTCKEALAVDPEDAASMRLAAATLWMRMLFEQGAVTVEDYLGQARANVTRKPPSPELAAAFRDYTERALSLAETRVRNRPDADAYFQLGSAAGLRASYVATVEGSVRESA